MTSSYDRAKLTLDAHSEFRFTVCKKKVRKKSTYSTVPFICPFYLSTHISGGSHQELAAMDSDSVVAHLSADNYNASSSSSSPVPSRMNAVPSPLAATLSTLDHSHLKDVRGGASSAASSSASSKLEADRVSVLSSAPTNGETCQCEMVDDRYFVLTAHTGPNVTRLPFCPLLSWT